MTELFIDDLAQAMEGGNCVGHQSLIVAVCETHGHAPLSWEDALLLLQEEGVELEDI